MVHVRSNQRSALAAVATSIGVFVGKPVTTKMFQHKNHIGACIHRILAIVR